MFEVGDVVVLRSGGPDMTVYGVRSDDHAEVNWFVGDELRDAVFHKDMLDLSEIEDYGDGEGEFTEEELAELHAKYPNGLGDAIVMITPEETPFFEVLNDHNEDEKQLKSDIEEYLKERSIGGVDR